MSSNPHIGKVVGEYTNFRMGARMPVNPLDKCTVISVFPEKITEHKASVFPGLFEIEAAPKDDFSLMVVGPASWWKEMEPNQPMLEIPHSSIQVAESFIRDWAVGLIACDMQGQMPGLFYIPGGHNKKSATDYKDLITGKTFHTMLFEARERQKKWFSELVRMADIMWVRTSGNPLAIDKNAKIAARELGLNKIWLQDYVKLEMSNCPACGSLVNPIYPVCSNCKTVINKEKAKELGLEFAK